MYWLVLLLKIIIIRIITIHVRQAFRPMRISCSSADDTNRHGHWFGLGKSHWQTLEHYWRKSCPLYTNHELVLSVHVRDTKNKTRSLASMLAETQKKKQHHIIFRCIQTVFATYPQSFADDRNNIFALWPTREELYFLVKYSRSWGRERCYLCAPQTHVMCQRSEWSRNVLLYDTAFQLIGYSWRSPVPTDTFRTNIKAMRSGRNSIAGRRPVSHSPFLLHRLTGVDALDLPRTLIVLPIHVRGLTEVGNMLPLMTIC